MVQHKLYIITVYIHFYCSKQFITRLLYLKTINVSHGLFWKHFLGQSNEKNFKPNSQCPLRLLHRVAG